MKRTELLYCFSSLMAPPSSLSIEKCENFTPYGREVIHHLFSCFKSWRIFQGENKDSKSKLYKKSCVSRNVGLNLF